MIKDSFKVTGKLLIKRKDTSDNIIEEIEVPNLIVKSGKEYIANRIAYDSTDGDGVKKVTRMGIGSNNSQTLNTTSNLGLQFASATATPSQTSGNTSVQFDALFDGNTKTGNMAEAGIYSATENTYNITSVAASPVVVSGAIDVGNSYYINALGSPQYNFTNVGCKLITANSTNPNNQFVIGRQYIIASMGTTTSANWNTIAGTTGVTYTVGSTFFAALVNGSGSGTAYERNFISTIDVTSLTGGATVVKSYLEFTVSGTSLGFSNGMEFTYKSGGTRPYGNLFPGVTYYMNTISEVSGNTTFRLSSSYANSVLSTPINIGVDTTAQGTQSFSKYTKDTLLCRSTFPYITKNANETVTISWTISVG